MGRDRRAAGACRRDRIGKKLDPGRIPGGRGGSGVYEATVVDRETGVKTPPTPMLLADRAACVTGVPLTQVHGIISWGLLGSAAARCERSRTVHREGPVSLKLGYETTAIPTH